jgi:hypothetical protein
MEDPRWFENWRNIVEYEKDMAYPRESYMMGVWMNSEHHFGLPERASTFKLRESTLENQ